MKLFKLKTNILKTIFAFGKYRKANKLISYKLQANKLQAKRGFAVLYAVLIASILLAIGLAIFNITIKELLLSSLGRESQFAFYAADSGIECAFYWDSKGNIFPTPSNTNLPGPGSGIMCFGIDISDYWNHNIDILDTQVTTTFKLDDPYCVNVTVTKTSVVGVVGQLKTKVESRGYNTCELTNPRRVERALRATY